MPVLGALAAEPLYVLVDTAIVGHLGTPQLASLAIAATLLTSAGQGYLRGMGDLRTPLVILVAAHAANVVLELVFRVRLRLGLAGVCGTVLAQLGTGAASLRRASDRVPAVRLPGARGRRSGWCCSRSAT